MTREEAIAAIRPFLPTNPAPDHTHISVPYGALKALLVEPYRIARGMPMMTGDTPNVFEPRGQLQNVHRLIKAAVAFRDGTQTYTEVEELQAAAMALMDL